MAKSIYFPTGSRLFETDKGTSGPTRWGVRVVLIPKASPCSCSQRTQDILARCPRVKEHSEQLLQGDKGMVDSSNVKVAKSNGQEGEKHLKIMVGLTREGMKPVEKCAALIDTGAEVCLIRRNLIPEEFYQPAVRPLRLWAANKQLINGGQDEVLLTMVVEGSQVNTAKGVELRLPTCSTRGYHTILRMVPLAWRRYFGKAPRLVVPQAWPRVLGRGYAWSSTTQYAHPGHTPPSKL